MRIVDLAQDIYEGMKVYPGRLKTVQFEHATHDETAPRFDSGLSFQTTGFMLNDNGPTHVAATARELGVGWHTIMRLVRELGTPIVADPDRVDPPAEPVCVVGVDETTFLAAAPTHPTEFATGITDLTPGRSARLLEVKRGRSAAVLADWLAERDPQWKQQIVTASLDPYRGYTAALAAQLPAATRVLAPSTSPVSV